jgi:hypothetical protein
MRTTWFTLLLVALGLGALAACNPSDDDDATANDDDVSANDDDSGGDDDDAADDDDATNDPPVFLNSFDFRLVQLENQVTGGFELIEGQMDVYVSSTVFRAELTTSNGQEWEWLGALVTNEESFNVAGEMEVSGAAPFFIRVEGNFLAGANQDPSRTCLTGIGRDDDLLNGGVELGYQFAWYACETDAKPAAIDRTGSYSVTVTTHADNCNAGWAGTWTEQWQFDGRLLIVTRGGFTGYGIVSDDGQVFRFTMLEAQSPGRALKVIGDFTAPTGNEEAIATGYCTNITPGALLGGVLDLDYP